MSHPYGICATHGEKLQCQGGKATITHHSQQFERPAFH